MEQVAHCKVGFSAWLKENAQELGVVFGGLSIIALLAYAIAVR